MPDPTPQAATPGQAAYEGMCRRALNDDGPRGRSEGWEALEPWQRGRWDAAAEAANRAGLPLVLAQAARYKAERDDYAARLKATDQSWSEVAAERDAARSQVASLTIAMHQAQAERDRYRQALEYVLRTSTDIGSRQDARRALAGEPQPWARQR